MPPPYIKTIREEIYYEYAKLISRSAFNSRIEYGLVINKMKELKDGKISISDTIREWQKEQQLPRECVYCGSRNDLTTDHLIPKNRGGDDSADNLVIACTHCNSARGNKGVFEWLGLEKKDKLHRLVAGKYLKQLLKIHEAAGTLDIPKTELNKLCNKCPLPDVCERWGTVGEMTCFCLESILPVS
jgi:predicted CopG family antitoxin